jgi:hypothetical protein
MTYHYAVFGLRFRADRELPGLNALGETSVIDYCLTFDRCSDRLISRELRSPWYSSQQRVKCGRKAVKVWSSENSRKFMFHYYDGVNFVCDRDLRQICVDGQHSTLRQAATHHLLFSLPGFLLGLRKSACLQGAAFGLGDGAIALLGGSKSGKSLLSVILASRGIDILSDDLVALDVIDSTIEVYPGYPFICLRSGSLHWLHADNLSSSQFRAEWEYLDETYVSWEVNPILASRKLEAIVLLVPQDSLCEPVIESVPGHQALMALMDSAGQTRIPYPEFRQQEFSIMGSVVAAVPTYRLRYHLSADTVAPLGDLLLQWAEARRR